jgi:hypothetical protein
MSVIHCLCLDSDAISALLLPLLVQEQCLQLLPRLNAWLEGWSCSLAGAGLSPEQLLTFSNAKSEFWLYLVEMLSKLTEHPDLQVWVYVCLSGDTVSCS